MKSDQAEAKGGYALKLARLWFALRHGWTELLAASPVLLAIAAFMYEQSAPAWGWLFGLMGYTFWGAVVASVPALRWTGIMIVSNLALAAGWSWLLHGISIPAIPSVLAGIFLTARASFLVRHGEGAIGQTFLLWLGLGACAPVAFIIHRVEGMQDYSPGLPVLAVLLFIAAILVSNSSSLSSGSYGGKHVSSSGRAMRRFNRLLVLGFGLLVLAVSFWGLIDSAIRSAARFLLGIIAMLFQGGEEQPVAPEPSAAPQQNPMELPPPEGEPAWIWVVLEYLMMAAMAAGAAWLLYLALRKLSRHLPGWLRAFLAWITRYRGGSLEEDAGYVDVVTSTRDDRLAHDRGPWSRLRRLFLGEQGVRWEELQNNSERMRYLYAQAIRRSIRAGFRWKPQWTPAETAAEAAKSPQAGGALPDDLCGEYERTRYGGKEPDDKLIEQLRAKVRERS
ncbi:MAG: hypothetical protein K0R57_5374 [Paenibacillaceae bacterium]|jgi:hypothetical protein|nr:hypothetical protein [Paenibacillaceae bacterium]